MSKEIKAAAETDAAVTGERRPTSLYEIERGEADEKLARSGAKLFIFVRYRTDSSSKNAACEESHRNSGSLLLCDSHHEPIQSAIIFSRPSLGSFFRLPRPIFNELVKAFAESFSRLR
jgi:hypothetical protein